MTQSQESRQDGAVATQTNTLRFQVRMESRWLQASVQTDHVRLIDLLNAGYRAVKAEQVVLLGDLYTYPGDQPNAGSLSLARALLVVPLDDGPVPDYARGSGQEGEPPALVRLGVGRFEVTGRVQTTEGLCLDEELSRAEGRFIAVNQAVLRRGDGGGPVERYDLILVNCGYVDYVLPAPALPLFDLTHGQLD